MEYHNPAGFDFGMEFTNMNFDAAEFAKPLPGNTETAYSFSDEGIDTTCNSVNPSFDPMTAQLYSVPVGEPGYSIQQNPAMDNTLNGDSVWDSQLNSFMPAHVQPLDPYGPFNTNLKRSIQDDTEDYPQPKRHEGMGYTSNLVQFAAPASATTSSFTLDAQLASLSNSTDIGLSDEAADVCAIWFSKYAVLPSDRHIDSLSQLTGEPAAAIRAWFGQMLKQGLAGHDSAYKSQTSLTQLDQALSTSVSQNQTETEVTTFNQDTTTSTPLRGGKKGCKPTASPELLGRDPTKIYQCTRKCGKRYGRKCDWKRNEEEGYPAKSWICSLCIEQGVEKVKPCFRRYHFSQHFRNMHQGIDSDAYEETSLVESETAFPRRCGFCPHRFESRQDRIDHIANHFKKGKCMREWVDPEDGDSHGSDNGDDDDSDNSDNSDNSQGKDGSTGNGSPGQNLPGDHQSGGGYDGGSDSYGSFGGADYGFDQPQYYYSQSSDDTQCSTPEDSVEKADAHSINSGHSICAESKGEEVNQHAQTQQQSGSGASAENGLSSVTRSCSSPDYAYSEETCPHCDERIGGIRELERHIARTHASVRTDDVCLEPSSRSASEVEELSIIPSADDEYLPTTRRRRRRTSKGADKEQQFSCALSIVGCKARFTSKREWKQHIKTQHFDTDFWRCDLCPPIVEPHDGESLQYHDFNRKDLFTQHLRRMHAAPAGCPPDDLKKHPVNDKNIEQHEVRCHKATSQEDLPPLPPPPPVPEPDDPHEDDMRDLDGPPLSSRLSVGLAAPVCSIISVVVSCIELTSQVRGLYKAYTAGMDDLRDLHNVLKCFRELLELAGKKIHRLNGDFLTSCEKLGEGLKELLARYTAQRPLARFFVVKDGFAEVRTLRERLRMQTSVLQVLVAADPLMGSLKEPGGIIATSTFSLFGGESKDSAERPQLPPVRRRLSVRPLTIQAITASGKEQSDHVSSIHAPEPSKLHEQSREGSAATVSVLNPRRGPWSSSEDSQLTMLVREQGAHNWVRISHAMVSRSPKQCRERYHEVLKPTLNHDPITPEEGQAIERMVSEMGKKWSEIARRLNGRSEGAVKNWWNGGVNRRKRVPAPQSTAASVSNCSDLETQSFQSLRLLGAGGFSTVDEVVHRATNLRISRKTLKNREKSALEEVKNEVEVLKKLRHPHIIRFLGVYSKGDKVSMLLSPVADTTLAVWLDKFYTEKQPALLHTVVKMFGCLTSSVNYLHEQWPAGRHGDIKPQNILITHGNRDVPHVILSDFGVSSSTTTDPMKNPTPLTRRYCAPEVLSGVQHTQASDIWSLGCVLLEMLTAALFQDNSQWSTLRKDFSGRGGKYYCEEVSRIQDRLYSLLGLATDVTETTALLAVSSMLQGKPTSRPTASVLSTIFTPAPCCLSWPGEDALFLTALEEEESLEKLLREDTEGDLDESDVQECNKPACASDALQGTGSFDLMKRWTDRCWHIHEACHRQGNDAIRLPTRLIKLQSDGFDGLSFRLVETAQLEDPFVGIQYAAISHIWQDQDLTLSSERLQSLQEEIPQNRLTKDLNDAITAAQHLGLKYIWVDSLCIIQDSADDRQRECGMIASVFRNAYITITAGDAATADFTDTDATSSDSDGSGSHQAILPIDWQLPGFGCTRAWCLQGRLLSTRFLHLTSGQMYWTCNELKASERFPDGLSPLVWEKIHSKSTYKNAPAALVAGLSVRHGREDHPTAPGNDSKSTYKNAPVTLVAGLSVRGSGQDIARNPHASSMQPQPQPQEHEAPATCDQGSVLQKLAHGSRPSRRVDGLQVGNEGVDNRVECKTGEPERRGLT